MDNYPPPIVYMLITLSVVRLYFGATKKPACLRNKSGFSRTQMQNKANYYFLHIQACKRSLLRLQAIFLDNCAVPFPLVLWLLSTAPVIITTVKYNGGYNYIALKRLQYQNDKIRFAPRGMYLPFFTLQIAK